MNHERSPYVHPPMLRTMALGAALALGQAGSSPLEAKDGIYDLGEKGKLEALGVCEITPDRVRCWDRQGEDRPALTKQVEALVTNSDYGQSFSFRFGRKNRYAVFASPRSVYFSLSAVGSDHGGYGGGRGGEDNLSLVQADLPPDAATLDVVATRNENERLPSADLPFVPGRTVEYGGATFEIGEAKPIPPPPKPTKPDPRAGGDPRFNGSSIDVNAGGLPGKKWSVILGRRPAGQGSQVQFEPIGADGGLIRYVDKEGHVVSEVKYLESVEPAVRTERFGAMPPAQSTKGYVSAGFQTGTGVSTLEAFAAVTNIAPTEIRALRLYQTQQVRILFRALPADPRSR